LNDRGAGVGDAVGIGTGVSSGVATTPGTLMSCEGAPGSTGTEGRVSGGGPGGGAGTCARAIAASAANAPSIDIKAARGADRRRAARVSLAEILNRTSSPNILAVKAGKTIRIRGPARCVSRARTNGNASAPL